VPQSLAMTFAGAVDQFQQLQLAGQTPMFIGQRAIQPPQPLDDDHSSHPNLENLPA
jgi:hypothetical protein